VYKIISVRPTSMLIVHTGISFSIFEVDCVLEISLPKYIHLQIRNLISRQRQSKLRSSLTYVNKDAPNSDVSHWIKKKRNSVWGSHSGGYEKFYYMAYNAV
jgi:hypothetical protein